MSLVAIHSVPRSGSTWLGQIFNSSPSVIYKYQPLFSYAFKDFLTPHSSRDEVLNFFKLIAEREDDFLDQKSAVEAGIVPRFSKQSQAEHIVYKEVRYHHILEHILQQVPEIKIIGLVRNPLATLASWKVSPKEFRPEWDFSEEWRSGVSKNQGRAEEFYGFDKWCEVAENFLRFATLFPTQFQLVRYQDLLGETEQVVSGLFQFCGMTMTEQTRHFLIASRAQNQADTYSVFKQRRVDDDWRGVLSDNIIMAVAEIVEQRGLSCFFHECDR